MKDPKPVKVTREPDDPLALRASIGGNDAVGFYLVFRGDPDEVLAMLERALEVAREELPGYRTPTG